MVKFFWSHFTPFYLAFLSRHTWHNSAKPKSNHKPTTYPTKYLRQYLADEDFLSHHPLRMYSGQVPVLYGCAYLLSWGWRFMVKQLNAKKLTFYANKISRWAVAQQIPGQLGSPGYQIDPHDIPDTKHCLLLLIWLIWRPDLLVTSKVWVRRVAMMTPRSDQQGDNHEAQCTLRLSPLQSSTDSCIYLHSILPLTSLFAYFLISPICGNNGAFPKTLKHKDIWYLTLHKQKTFPLFCPKLHPKT